MSIKMMKTTRRMGEVDRDWRHPTAEKSLNQEGRNNLEGIRRLWLLEVPLSKHRYNDPETNDAVSVDHPMMMMRRRKRQKKREKERKNQKMQSSKQISHEKANKKEAGISIIKKRINERKERSKKCKEPINNEESK